MTEWVESPGEQPEAKEEPSELGPTGEYPKGKISEDDEGELKFAVGVTRSAEVFLEFGTPVRWMAMPPEQAVSLAEVLAVNAQKAVRVAQEMAKPKEVRVLLGPDGNPVEGVVNAEDSGA